MIFAIFKDSQIQLPKKKKTYWLSFPEEDKDAF